MLYFEHERLLKWPTGAHEHYVPLHASDLIEFLVQHPEMDSHLSDKFRQIAALILSMQHHLYRQHHSRLIYSYAALDPDLVKMLSSIPIAPQRNRLAEQVRDQVRQALQFANYRLLSREEIEESLRLASVWGVRMRVRFDLQDWMDVYAMGSAIGHRTRRRWQNFFRKSTEEIPVYSRLAVIFRPSLEHPQKFDARFVYLRLFKNVPRRDIDMMLPGAGIQMSWLDHSRIVLPSLYTVAVTIWRIVRNVFLLALFGVFKTVGIAILVLLALGYGVKNLFSFRSNMVRRYMLNMAQSLYFQSLDNNAGVLLQILEEAEQQQSCEAILVYYAIASCEDRRSNLEGINQRCRNILMEATGLEILFDATKALDNLSRFLIVHQTQDYWIAQSMPEAIVSLDALWDSWFTNSN